MGGTMAGAAGGTDLKMNLRSFNNVAAGVQKNASAMTGIFRQSHGHALSYPSLMILPSVRAVFLVVCLLCASFFSIGFTASGQTNYYNTNGTEYAVIGSLPGDQVYPDVAVSPAGGFVVWQDNITDGSGWGISARSLNSTLSGSLGTFRVNAIGAGDQEYPRVALLNGGGAVFVWQGGPKGFQHIYARFLTATNTFQTTNDVMVNASTNYFQLNPAVAVLNNSNVVVVWSSYDEAGSNTLSDVYAQIFSPTGQKIGGEFPVNQFTAYNQRTPAVAALPNGNFIVAWISEQERNLAPSGSNTFSATPSSFQAPSVDVYARVFTNTGTASAGEFLANTDNNPCASPTVAVATDGSYLIAWCARDIANPTNSLDIYGRTFNNAGVGGTVFYLNSYLYGDQYSPRVSALGLDYLATWTSKGEDGSREGVYARFVHNDGSLVGNEFRVNTTTASQQMHPSVASDGNSQFIVVWTSFTGLTAGFDLYAQRYLNASAVLVAMPAPFIWVPFVLSNNVYQPQLLVSWAPLLGLSVSNYEVYLDGAVSPTVLLTSNKWTMTAANGLTTNSTHSFQVDYVLNNGKRSPISPSASGTTWSGLNWGGIPYEWMAAYFGGYYNGHYITNNWPAPGSSVLPGPSLQQVFLSGGNPYDPTSWLSTQFTRTAQGMFISWNTQAGATYQVQNTTDLVHWSNFGSARFAAGTTDSINVGGANIGYFRVILLR
jgi:hypothetical protein